MAGPLRKASSAVVQAEQAMPPPRCTSEIIKPSEMFIKLMMLEPLTKGLPDSPRREQASAVTTGSSVLGGHGGSVVAAPGGSFQVAAAAAAATPLGSPAPVQRLAPEPTLTPLSARLPERARAPQVVVQAAAPPAVVRHTSSSQQFHTSSTPRTPGQTWAMPSSAPQPAKRLSSTAATLNYNMAPLNLASVSLPPGGMMLSSSVSSMQGISSVQVAPNVHRGYSTATSYTLPFRQASAPHAVASPQVAVTYGGSVRLAPATAPTALAQVQTLPTQAQLAPAVLPPTHTLPPTQNCGVPAPARLPTAAAIMEEEEEPAAAEDAREEKEEEGAKPRKSALKKGSKSKKGGPQEAEVWELGPRPKGKKGNNCCCA